MARVSIYVPDEMKSEMDAFEEKANWSNVAQQAFGLEIERLKLPKEAAMMEVIERLRASKAEEQHSDKDVGFKDGREWAMKTATFAELKRMSRLDYNDYENAMLAEDTGWQWLDEAMKIDQRSDPELSLFYNGEELEAQSDEYVEAFMEGAQQIWNEVADKI